MIELDAVWKAINAARIKAKENGSEYPMNPPATLKMIEQLSQTLGTKIPNQLKDSLLIHNGMNEQEGVWFASLIPSSIENNQNRLARRPPARSNWPRQKAING